MLIRNSRYLEKLLLIFVTASLGVTSGCGSGGPERFALSGNVSYDGQPVADGEIAFTPVDESPGVAAGSFIVDGHYDIKASDGPTAGKYTAFITAMRPTGKMNRGEGSSPPAELRQQYIPATYNTESTLEVEITDDRDDLDFLLEKVAPEKRRR